MKVKNNSLYDSILEFVNSYYNRFARSPSTREISEGTNISRATVQRYLQDLKVQGIIQYDGHRSIITPSMRGNNMIGLSRIPLIGSIPCGDLNESFCNELESFMLPQTLIGEGDFFFLEAHGDSMINAGIDNGDLVLIKRQSFAQSGQIVAFLFDSDQTTLKRYFPHSNHISLHPENKQMKDIIISEDECSNLVIQGIATMVIKRLK